MCYNISIKSYPMEMEDLFRARFEDSDEFVPYYHVSAFARPRIPVITNENPEVIQLLRWGFVPRWVKDEKQAAEISQKTLNARAETLFEKPSFREAIVQRRCLIPVNGFFEWKHENGKKYPYFIRLKDAPLFTLGGIWDEWINKGTGEIIKSFSIITTEANSMMAQIHNTKMRMPLILSRDSGMTWLKNSLKAPEIRDLMKPFDEKKMEAYTVSIHQPNSNTPASIEKHQY
ncbi:MAG: SOS response-associated peptidase [Ignavibacteriales bacterium]